MLTSIACLILKIHFEVTTDLPLGLGTISQTPFFHDGLIFFLHRLLPFFLMRNFFK